MARQTRQQATPAAPPDPPIQPEPPPPERPRLVRGGLMAVERDGVVGWAWDANNPDSFVDVRLVAGGAVVGAATANQFDDDRVRTLVGPGVPGFITRLATIPPGPYPITLQLHDAAGTRLGMPMLVNSAAELAGAAGSERVAAYEGHIDGVFDGRLMGWVRNHADPDEAVQLTLLDTGSPIATVTANTLRTDLRDAGLHHGLYGYVFDLPVALLDGRAHSLAIRVSRASYVLQGGPIAFGPLASSALIGQLGALRTEVADLRRLVDGLVAPDGLVQRRIMGILSDRVAAQAEIQRESTERDLEALRRMVFAAAAAPEPPAPAAPRLRRGG